MTNQEQRIDWANVNDAAALCVGNMRNFEAFAYFGDADVDEVFCYHTQHRESDLLEQSNTAAIYKELDAFTGLLEDGNNVEKQTFSHSLVGWIEALLIRVYDADGKPTQAFTTFCELMERLEQYPVLNEEDWGERESNATWENVQSEVNRILNRYDIEIEDLDELTGKVYSLLPDHELEALGGFGAYPSDDSVEEALVTLGLLVNEE